MAKTTHITRALTRRTVLAAGSAAGAAAFLSACSSEPRDTGQAQQDNNQTSSDTTARPAIPGGTLKTSIAFDTDTLDPIRARAANTSYVAAYTYNRPLKFKAGRGEFADGTLEPDAMDRWEQPDELTLLLHLRQGMRLDQRAPTNGRAITTEDVTLSWETFAQEGAYRGDLANSANGGAPIVSVRAMDATTIEVKSAFADAQMLPAMNFWGGIWILPKEAFTGGFDPATAMRGAGPWILEQYQPSIGFIFKKNTNYYDAPSHPLLDGVDMPIIIDTAQMESQFKARNVHFGGGYYETIPLSDILPLHQELSGTRLVLSAPESLGPTISFSWRQSNPYRDKRIRKAISMLLDREAFIEVFRDIKNFQSAGVEMRSYLSAPYGAGYGPFWLDPKSDSFGESARNYRHNVAEAKKLLAAAGYPDGFEAPFTFVAGPRYGRDWGQRAEALMSMLSQGGIRAKANAVDYTSVWVPQYLRAHGDFDGMAMYPNGARADPGQWLHVFFSSTGANNQVGTMFPDLDQRVAKQRRELDHAKRISIFHDIQRYFAEEMPAVPQGGATESPTLVWNGLHGPGEYFEWAGNTNSYGGEVEPYYWLDDSLRG